MTELAGFGLKEDLVELSLDIEALVAQTISTFLDCAKQRQTDGNLIHVTGLLSDKAELFRKLVRRVNTRNDTEEYVKELESHAKDLNQIVVEKATSTQEAFNILADSSFLAKKTHAKAVEESKYVEPEEIVRFSHLISKNFSVCSPHFWQQGDPMRPFPTDLQYRMSLLAQSDGIASPKELHETTSETDEEKPGSSNNLYLNGHDGGLRDLKMNDLPVLNEFFVSSTDLTASTDANASASQPGHNIGLISSDEESSDSDF
uniref:Mediator of RNA polymerase II transcription subunit 4 n=1 Tax=Panagrolaimus sp. JU765 TaxID=591449 RepID=A0AC34Q2N5_9BILA